MFTGQKNIMTNQANMKMSNTELAEVKKFLKFKIQWLS